MRPISDSGMSSDRQAAPTQQTHSQMYPVAWHDATVYVSHLAIVVVKLKIVLEF